MNRLERTLTKYEPTIRFIYTNTLPIGLDALTIDNTVLLTNRCGFVDTLQNVGEEIGHVKTTAGDISKYSTKLDIQQEQQARQYGCRLLVNLDGIIACYKAGITTPWDMADFFEVSEPYIWRAIDSYRIKRGIDFTYKGYEFNLNNGLAMTKL